MVDAYIGEIRAFPFNIVPRGWTVCDGRLLSIPQNTALFAVIGNNFDGGDGKTTFAVPNLVDRVAMGVGMAMGMNNNLLGEQFGSPSVSLREADMPRHNHQLQRKGHGSGSKTAAPSGDAFYGQVLVADANGQHVRAAESFVATGKTDTMLDPAIMGVFGRGFDHENRQPFLTLVYCICIDGIFPPR